MTEQAARTQTFVFTDVEGSTALLRALGDSYQGVLREHDGIIASAAEAKGGEVFGSEGDAQFIVFDEPAAAVAAAAEAQRVLAAHTWPAGHQLRVRMGIHAGEARRDAGGFVGLALHETARISAAAHGGQVLLSPAAAELVRGRLPDGVELRDLGEHQLKDIEGAVHLFQLCIAGLDQDFPALRARAMARISLPRPITSFVERTEVATIADIAAGARLLTLTGPGGTGKTRLAIAVAERVAERFEDGTWFVALDAVSEVDVVPSEIVTALGLSPGAGAPLERLVGHLRERSALLVLDNLEQVIEAGEAIAHIVGECPRLAVIATSRIPLRVYGEQEFPVPALPLPAANGVVSAESLSTVASVRLFEDRARAAKPAFAVTDDNAADVADIVARLDGLPLAIELAAARVRLLPPAALRKRLDDRLSTLTGGDRDRPGRQQTLRGAIAWSHDLLDEPDRRLFARFGALAGSAALPQIEAVTGPADEIGRDVFDGLESLVQQSLVRVVESDEDEPRFGMLATIREYSRERLEERGEAEHIRRRHAEVYLALAEEAAPDLLGADGAAANDRLERDHDDLRAALDWIVAHDEAELGLRMIIALWRFWQVRGHLYEATERVAAVLAMPSVTEQPAALRSRALGAAGGVAYWRSMGHETMAYYVAALELARQADDKGLVAESHYNAAFAQYADRSSRLEDLRAEVIGHLDEALRLYRELEDERGVARTSWSLAVHAASDDRVDDAWQLASESLAAARSVADQYQIGWSLHTLGQADIARGDIEAARRHILESFEIWAAAGDVSGLTLLMVDAAIVARARGAEACSWRLLGAEERLRTETGTNLGEYTVEFKGIAPRRETENEEEAGWFEEGRRLSTEEAIALVRGSALGD